MNNKYRYEVDDPDFVDDIMEKCKVKNKRELFDNALTLLEWAIDRVMSGRSIGSLDDDKQFFELEMPILNKIKNSKRSMR